MTRHATPTETDTRLTRNEDETEALGRHLATRLRGGEVIALYGDLGAGKTVFARGLARGLGIALPITSPTFAIVQEYQGADLRFYHVDLYRLGTAAEAQAFGLDEMLADPHGVTAIEWPERLGPQLAACRPVVVRLAHDPAGRRVTVTAGG